MSVIAVEADKCKRDGFCVAVCPSAVLELKDGVPAPTAVPGMEEFCVRCGHCVAVCPTAALSHEAMAPGDCAALETAPLPKAEQVAQLLRSRRSIRAYRDRPVEREKLERLLDLARSAPTGGNSQQVRWTVASSRKAVHAVASAVVDMMRLWVAQKVPFVADYDLARLVSAWDSGLDPITRGAPAMLFALAPKENDMGSVDCSIALTFVDVAAPSLGLGTCWAGFAMVAAGQWAPLQEQIALPDGYVCRGAMMVGYPKYRYHRTPRRNEVVAQWLA